ncbi:MAG: ABC transporter substrate-binding protein [Rhodoplanes sp.]|uniref:ABC transporter substrate-binding protein n=1 Tax=Rhodoplanes sp. TaxID=1968906 RepID=UPI00181CA6F8|nr:ABC transporter substrate-binding protein [Rhodoplanes sp.]NVO16390.1 ABC transporter substrate-binding protein [Rhodoplanes sp.]
MISRRRFATAGAVLLAASAMPARAATPVRIGFVPVIGASAVYVLQGAGWAAADGLAITMTKFDSGPAAIQALASGTLDMLAIGVAPLAVARSKGIGVRIVAAGATGGSGFVAGPALAEALATGTPAQGFAAFRAKTGRRAKLATLPPGGVPTVLLHHWLWTIAKVDRADVEIVHMGIEAVQQAMLVGAVDGGTVLEPSRTLVLDRDPRLKSIVVANEMFAGIPGVAFGVTEKFADANRDALDTLIRLLVRATTLIETTPAEAAPHVAASLGGGLVDTGVFAKALASPAVIFGSDPRAIVAPTEALLAYQVELGDFPTAPATDGLFDLAAYARALRTP